ncbi:unnamed protein product [Ilex paraguariensis]|uniref:Uncharacterized protein n=1 Tax=Ilex paraguariensis TaxID=185542 RepID=A0ABC8TAV6_9AQUA
MVAILIACHETLFTEGRDLKSKKEVSPPVENTQNLGLGSSAAVLKDDFRPTTPGNSPGVVHAFAGHHDIDTKPKALGNAAGVGHSVARNTDDFRPTMPGHSPGEILDLAQNLEFCSSAAVFKDDFRSTRSGSSPGEGHGDIDTKPNALGNAPGVDHSVAGNTDDFRPTVPGHSPGVGYSFPTKIGEYIVLLVQSIIFFFSFFLPFV